ncbi:MAG: AI-2E family transporter [Microbacteriaceae bacterium]|jgi:predicted PurR-regulated permease PerM|nr:AI-2E family transporter [Microbacteriaceae bacterium]MCI1207335.1 AI-2E family transporter [Microbacteriaceae bacterium]
MSERAETTSLWKDGFGRAGARSLQILAVLAVVAIVIAGIMALSIVTIPLVLAVIVGCSLYPVPGWLGRHGWPRLLAVWTTLVGIVLVIGAILLLVGWAVVSQWSELSSQASAGFSALQRWMGTLPFDISLPNVRKLGAWAADVLTSTGFRTGALAGVSAAGQFFTGFGVFVVLLFFFIKEGPALWEFCLRPFHSAAYHRGVRGGMAAASTFGGYLRGTTVVAAADALGIGVGLWILQVPLALPLAVVVFVTAYIPIVGATLAGILGALVALVANGPVSALLVAAVVVLVNQLEGNLLQPLVMGRTLKLHPLIILIALTVGSALGGILGAIIAVPLTAAGWAVLKVWDGPDTPARIARQKHEEEQRLGEGS